MINQGPVLSLLNFFESKKASHHGLRYVAAAIFLLSLGILTSCRISATPHANILLIAVDSFGSDAVNCLREKKQGQASGLDELCETSVRFTHAYTPSVISVTALASALSGLNPFEHKIHDNSRFNLSGEITTLAELARTYRRNTYFYSGGPSILRKTGLHQGYDLFEDTVPPGRYTVSFRKNLTHFLSMIDETPTSAFFATFYVPDLLHEEILATNILGEPRPQTYDSKLEELDESLNDLISELKKRRRWDNTHVFLFGLNGRPQPERPKEKIHLNLLSERTQVSFLAKLAAKPRDRGLSWTVDKYISLIDIFPTVRSLLENENPANENYEGTLAVATKAGVSGVFSSQNLVPLMTSTARQEYTERFLYLESGWGSWQGLANGVRAAGRADSLLYVHDQVPFLVNSLIDRAETNPIKLNENSKFAWTIRDEFRKLGIEPFKLYEPKKLEPKVITTRLNNCLVLFRNAVATSSERKLCDCRLALDLSEWWIQSKFGQDIQKRDEAKAKFLRSYGYYFSDKHFNDLNSHLGKIWDLSDNQLQADSLIEDILKGSIDPEFRSEVQLNLQNIGLQK